MGKRQISVCKICGLEKCSGKIYLTPEMWGSYGFYIGVEKKCEHSEGVFCDRTTGKLMYKLVSGHGDYRYFELVESGDK